MERVRTDVSQASNTIQKREMIFDIYLSNKIGESWIAQKQPSPWSNAIRLVQEFFRCHGVEVAESNVDTITMDYQY